MVPPAICTGCNTGLQPTVNVDRSRVDTARTQRVMNGYAAGTGTTNHGTGGSTLANEADKIVRTITGYECDCDGTHPTRPAVILDPFCGTGTVPMVARILGRTGIGVDLSADYLKLADWRVHGSDHARKTLDRMGPTLQPVRPDLLVDDIPLPFGAAS